MQFQWYPGHMTKAKRQMQEDIKLIDLVIDWWMQEYHLQAVTRILMNWVKIRQD